MARAVVGRARGPGITSRAEVAYDGAPPDPGGPMAPRGTTFHTSLSLDGCDQTFKKAASEPLFKNWYLRFGEKMARAGGNMQTGTFAPEPSPGFPEQPAFSLGFRFENQHTSNVVCMDVWDRGDRREVYLYEAGRSKLLKKFVEAFRATGSTDLR
jgi:hypothetical protein